MSEQTESFEGYVIDQSCITTNTRDELPEAARQHSRDCALAGKCMESGYGLVDADEGLLLLDPDATPKVVALLESADEEQGIRLRVEREADEDGNMATERVEQVA